MQRYTEAPKKFNVPRLFSSNLNNYFSTSNVCFILNNLAKHQTVYKRFWRMCFCFILGLQHRIFQSFIPCHLRCPEKMSTFNSLSINSGRRRTSSPQDGVARTRPANAQKFAEKNAYEVWRTSDWPYCNISVCFIFDPYIYVFICIFTYKSYLYIRKCLYIYLFIIYRVNWDVLEKLNWRYWGDEHHPFTPLRGKTTQHIFLNKRTSKCEKWSFWTWQRETCCCLKTHTF